MSIANEPAYPAHGPDSRYAEWAQERQPGLTKRELFAAMAMQGMLSLRAGQNVHEVAYNALGYADALLGALKES